MDRLQDVNELVQRWQSGDREAINSLIPAIYTELHTLAHYFLQRERADHTLQTTALVHEAYLKLRNQSPFPVENKDHFVAVAARLMRQILVDYARRYRAAKRGPECRVELQEDMPSLQRRGADVIALDDALKELAEFDSQQSLIVELKFFGGMTTEEIAAVLGLSPDRTQREWSVAKAWLTRQLRRGNDGQSAAMGKD